MPVNGSLLGKVVSGKERKLHDAVEIMLRRVLEGMGLNIQPTTEPKAIQRQMVIMGIAVQHIIDEPGKPKNNQIPSGYYFYKNKKLAHILFEPYFDKKSGEIIIKQGRVTVD